jgi:WD40 repeat protein
MRQAWCTGAAKLLALGELHLAEDPTEALAYATASLDVADTGEARVFAMKALREAPPAIELVADSQAAQSPAFSPDGEWLATAGMATNTLVWSKDGRGPLELPGDETSSSGIRKALWASNDLLATGSNGTAGSRAFLWSLPDGRPVRTIDFGGPSYWQVGQGKLFAETVESGTAEDPGPGVLRSWPLPQGEPTLLGHFDWGKLGTSTTFFAPDGSNWFYAKDRNLYARTLPAGAGPDRIRARLGSELADFWATVDWLAVADKSGETRVWSFPDDGRVQEKVIRKPDAASYGMVPDISGRWLAGDPNIDQQIRLWDLTKWPSARPLSLRRSGSWYAAKATFHPAGEWVVASTATVTRLTFWPLVRAYPSVVDGYTGFVRPLAFSPDGKWLATGWSDQGLRLWPLPGNGVSEMRFLALPETGVQMRGLAFDPRGRYIFAVAQRRVWVIPIDGSPPRRLRGYSEGSLLNAAAVSPSGRRVATAYWWGGGEKTLLVWDLETGEVRRFDLPASAADASETRTGYEQGIASIAFADESTLFTAGDGGLRRWNLETGAQEVVAATATGYGSRGSLLVARGLAITADFRLGQWENCPRGLLHDLTSDTLRELPEFGACSTWSKWGIALDPSGTVAAIGSIDGTVRVERLAGGEPHLLVGHKGAVDYIAISPDLRWVATTGMDNTVRLWPMPDLSKPPLHTLPRDELLAKLHSLTNLRVVRDPPSPNGWRVEVGPFPGWKNVPTW